MRKACVMKKIGLLLLILTIGSVAHAQDKNWTAGGDGVSWIDGVNWFPAEIPTDQDDVRLLVVDASAVVTDDFTAKSITLAGRGASTLTVNNFVDGRVEPDSATDIAILNRKDGELVLKGSGTVTVTGTYKDSEEAVASQPSFIFSLS